jgi:acetyl-CoA carboxylase carboxyl transferase subunit alpha
MAKSVLEFEKPIIELEQKMEEMRRYGDNPDIALEIGKIEKRVNQLQLSIYAGLTRWQKVQLARRTSSSSTETGTSGMTGRSSGEWPTSMTGK